MLYLPLEPLLNFASDEGTDFTAKDMPIELTGLTTFTTTGKQLA
jgi:hypothetical protein